MSEIVKNTFIPALADVAEKLGWTLEEYEDYLELTTWSPAGENVIVSIPKEEETTIAAFLSNYALKFDEEEHVAEMLKAKENGLCGVPDMETLIKDAKDIQEMLSKLADTVGEIQVFEIPVVWQQMGYLACYGTSQQNAAEVALAYDRNSQSGDALPLPKESWYLDDSFEIDMDGIAPDPTQADENTAVCAR